jgi:OmpA-OmpF porin, OOP family
VGSESYNMELAQKRAESVRNFLIQGGIASHRITAHSLGKGYPVASNDTEAGRLQNRRVEIIISNEASRSASIPR